MAEWRNPTVLGQLSELLDSARTWPEAKGKIERAPVSAHLDAAGWQAALQSWHRKAAARLSEHQLVDDLRHWSEGRSYTDHLDGYNALPPLALIAEARRRGWFVRELSGGGSVVSLPGGGVLRLAGDLPKGSGG